MCLGVIEKDEATMSDPVCPQGSSLGFLHPGGKIPVVGGCDSWKAKVGCPFLDTA